MQSLLQSLSSTELKGKNCWKIQSLASFVPLAPPLHTPPSAGGEGKAGPSQDGQTSGVKRTVGTSEDNETPLSFLFQFCCCI